MQIFNILGKAIRTTRPHKATEKNIVMSNNIKQAHISVRDKRVLWEQSINQKSIKIFYSGLSGNRHCKDKNRFS